MASGPPGGQAMKPRLISVAGPLKGSIFPLDDSEITLGRLETNGIAVPDMAVSRTHCAVRREAGRFKLQDLDSRNGTFVNSMPVKERWLEEGDRIEIGDSQFIFRTAGEEAVVSGPVQLEEGEVISGSTLILRREDAIYLQPERTTLASTDLPTVRQVRDLQALVQISQVINSTRDLGELAGRLLQLILEFIPADRGAILLGSEKNHDFAAVFGLDRAAGSRRPVQVSRTLVRRVMEQQVALLSNDVSRGDQLSESLVASRTTAVLAVPLPGPEKALGAIYLASSNPAARFDEGHLQLATGIAGLAAVAFENVRRLESLQNENERLQNEIQIEHKMIGNSAAMQEVYRFIERAARQNSTVLIRGESGTGKELVARALHANSPRASQPFVAVNCAALTESLLESELFGHEKGAFTGAVSAKKGRIEIADGGTLFLDEIAELAPSLQAKLLRVLQEREFERVGGTRPLKVNIRVIAATNRDLEQQMERGAFRQDLFFRLNVVTVNIPPLRERKEDVLPLAQYFVAKHCRQATLHVKTISPEAQVFLLQYDWPGNVRELENAMERGVVLGSAGVIRAEDLPEVLVETEPAPGHAAQYHEAVRQAKKDVIAKALERTGGSYTEAAKLLGIHVNYLHRVIRTLDLKAALRHSGSHSISGS